MRSPDLVDEDVGRRPLGLRRSMNDGGIKGILENPEDIVSYLNKKGVSVVFMFRRNTLRRLISVLANDYDKDAKQLNGTHKSRVHSKEEVSSMHKQFQTEFSDIALFC
ncbi:unnamed protein product [Miscanthus lutarioriparius]|uniref:Uncharacterized protein n=1 Tax=Miscanthus lutarioriparius TaxID=422564 RepID=A0A811NH92_9POAL|nr:unnamed protein product [Miscanthus lutarioriparius]